MRVQNTKDEFRSAGVTRNEDAVIWEMRIVGITPLPPQPSLMESCLDLGRDALVRTTYIFLDSQVVLEIKTKPRIVILLG